MDVLQKSSKKSKPSEVFSKFKKSVKNAHSYLFYLFLAGAGFWLSGFIGGMIFGFGVSMLCLIYIGRRQQKKNIDRIIRSIQNNESAFNSAE